MPSSVIKTFAYDSQRQVLTITFVSGRAYAYQDVPAGVADGLRLAFAKGQYFNRAIRDRFDAKPLAPSSRP
ncbi:KTSC domain-containing protein [Caulobacter sp. 1776]|uniref:KTSC domain-containing protein n=1 Tax=Caulobacter sp. 1776 TaxID=3156420 RepID=UPI00339A869E